jgi:hypothetical protein
MKVYRPGYVVCIDDSKGVQELYAEFAPTPDGVSLSQMIDFATQWLPRYGPMAKASIFDGYGADDDDDDREPVWMMRNLVPLSNGKEV